MMDLKQMMDNFLSVLEVEQKSEKTIENYKVDLNSFLSWFNRQGYKSIEEVSLNGLRAYISTYKACKPRTIARKVASLKSFYRFLSDDGSIQNVSVNLKAPKIESKKPVIMSDDSATKIIAACKDSEGGRNEQRDYVVLKLLFCTGLRREELTTLKVGDIDFKNRRILVHGKGNKERYVYPNAEMMDLLGDYIDSVRIMFYTNKRSDFLFISQQSGSLSVGTVNNIVNKYMEKAGVKVKGISTHSARKKFANSAYNATGDIYAVAEVLGHGNINTTKIYTNPDADRARNVCSAVNF